MRDATDIVAVISEHLALKKVGRRFVGLCPFHGEKHPVLLGEPRVGSLLLLRLPGQGRRHHLRPRAGPHRLRRGGGAPRPPGRGHAPLHRPAVRARDASAGPPGRGHGRRPSTGTTTVSSQAPDAAAARAYLRYRGFDGETVRTYQLGWAPDDWDELAGPCRLPDKRAGRHRPGLRQPAPAPAGLLPGPGAVPDLRPPGRPGRLRRANHAGRRGTQVPQHRRDHALRQEPGALRAQLGQGRAS